ncbi:MAG: hypothetical protein CMA64_05825 [Euryarchaeota archaeon]|mgnify:FL=1|nr:hypothetical protein [Euryarchaeota archaeon]|tara:strand:+ start:385 stop:930 length:546 start_codon:yes stop_codon:yes gene_type:complete
MDRPYSDGNKDSVEYFVGKEVEKTPAYDRDTLFVVGMKPYRDVIKLATRNNCDHIYLGANQSFSIEGQYGTQEETDGWDELVTELLKAGFWVTLDYDVRFHDFIMESGYNEHDQFISMISVKLPYIDQLNYNACIKIDDTDFKASNPGVWVYYASELKDRKKFTPWSEYEKDQPIKLDSEH